MAKLLSVNVGLPRDIEWQGRTARTAVWKEPVSGRRWVRRLNVDGDGQGDLSGHGGEQRAVFVYQIDSYRFWENELRRSDFVFGQFGENLTVEGLSDQEVCSGDRYRVGGALFEVSLPSAPGGARRSRRCSTQCRAGVRSRGTRGSFRLDPRLHRASALFASRRSFARVDRADLRPRRLLARANRATRRWQCPDVLLDTHLRCGSGSLNSCIRTYDLETRTARQACSLLLRSTNPCLVGDRWRYHGGQAAAAARRAAVLARGGQRVLLPDEALVVRDIAAAIARIRAAFGL